MHTVLLKMASVENFANHFEGTDLNRTWDTASPHAHPTVHTIRDVIDKLSKTVFTSFADDSKYF